MSSQGPFNAGAGTQFGIGTAWTTPNNISGGGSVQSVLNGGLTTRFLQATAFGFSIPLGSVITGFSVFLNRVDPNNSGLVVDAGIFLLKAGVQIGIDHSVGTPYSSPPDITYGGSTDLWGAVWTPSDVNASNFGVEIKAANNDTVSHNIAVSGLTLTVFFSGGLIIPVIQTG